LGLKIREILRKREIAEAQISFSFRKKKIVRQIYFQSERNYGIFMFRI